jgi:hypothetical protein
MRYAARIRGGSTLVNDEYYGDANRLLRSVTTL